MAAKAENVCSIFARGLGITTLPTVTTGTITTLTSTTATITTGTVTTLSSTTGTLTTGNLTTGNITTANLTTTVNEGLATAGPPKKYVYARASGGALANGDVVIWSGGYTFGDTVEKTTTADDPMLAGVASATISSGSYGLIQYAGVHTAVKVDGGTTDVTAKDFLATGVASGKAQKAASTLVAGGVLGIALQDCTGGASTGAVLIKLA